MVYQWHDAFVKKSRTSAKLKSGPGASIMKLTEVLMKTDEIIMQEDSQLTECELAQILQIVPSTTYVLLTKKLGLSRICARWIPRSLTAEPQAEHVQILRLVLAKWKQRKFTN